MKGSHAHTGAAGHAHGLPAVGESRARATRVLKVVLAINGAMLVGELIGGFLFGSLALLADAAHMVSDVAGLIIALIAQSLMGRPTSDRHTFGLLRAESLGAQLNAVLLVVSTIWIAIEALERLRNPLDVEGLGVVIVGGIGLLVNVGSAFALARERGHNLNIEGAYVHMMADALGSVGAVAAGIAVLVFDARWVDPLAGLVIAVFVLVSAWGLLQVTTRVLMEAAPKHLDTERIIAAIRTHDGVEDVHHVHLWSLSADMPALSAHVALAGETDLHRAQLLGDAIREHLSDEFGIAHATLALECSDCGVGHAPHGH